jgi:hypothetical protein
MIAETISLGILALPAALSTLGAIPYVSLDTILPRLAEVVLIAPLSVGLL